MGEGVFAVPGASWVGGGDDWVGTVQNKDDFMEGEAGCLSFLQGPWLWAWHCPVSRKSVATSVATRTTAADRYRPNIKEIVSKTSVADR